MSLETTWGSLKGIKIDTGSSLYWTSEDKYTSNDGGGSDSIRYYIRINSGVENYYSFIDITDPKNSDQIDFEDNYKSSAIEV